MQIPIRVIQRVVLHTLVHVIAPRLPKGGAIHTSVDEWPRSRPEKSQNIEELNEHLLDEPVSKLTWGLCSDWAYRQCIRAPRDRAGRALADLKQKFL